MQFGSELDMQELEYQLYNQVYHSYVDWDKEHPAIPDENLNPSHRRVTEYSVNNSAPKKGRYWRGEDDPPVTSTAPATTQSSEKSDPPSSTHNESPKALADDAKEAKKARKKAKRKARKATKSRTAFVKYCRDYATYNEDSNSQTQQVPYTEPVLNPAHQVTQILTPVVKESSEDEQKPVFNKNIAIKMVEQEVVVLSDSDDSIEEVPLPPPPPIPTYTIESSDEESSMQKKNETEQCAANPELPHTESSSEKQVNNVGAKVSNSACEEKTSLNETPECVQDNLDKANENIDAQVPNLSEVKTTSLSERAELLNTPDSAVNDFIQSDIEDLSRNNPRFNFNLHECDLAHIANEFPRPKHTANVVSATDIYETESSCSEIGNPTESVTTFQEVNFGLPTKEIFSEPGLASFSNFITPIRKESKTAKSNRFKAVPTKASTTFVCPKKIENKNCEEVTDDSNTQEYDSDPTILKKKRKRKSCKKKSKSGKKSEKETNQIVEKRFLNSMETVTSENKKAVDEMDTTDFLKDTMSGTDNKKDETINSGANTDKAMVTNISKPEDEKTNQLDGNNKQKMPDINNSMRFCDDHFEEIDYVDKHEEIDVLDHKTNSDNDEIIDVCGDNPLNNLQQSVSSNFLGNNSTRQQFSFLQAWAEIQSKSESSSNIIELQINSVKQIKNLEIIKFNNNVNNDNSVDSDEKEIDVGVETNFAELQKIDNNIIVLSDSENENISTRVQTVNNIKVEVANKETLVKQDELEETLLLNISPIIEKPVEKPENSKRTTKRSTSKKKKLVKNPFNVSHKKSFSDYWTTDMKKFYDESWGQENFDLEKELATMPSDPSKWKIIPEDIYKTPVRKNGPRCLRCKEFGHTRYECKKLPGQEKCSACGGNGHFHARCPNLMCTTCGRKGGYHTTSCSNCFNYVNIRCSICQMKGHIDRNCPDLWRRYHLTTKNHCYPRKSNMRLKPVKERWCCGCAQQGHFQHECPVTNFEHFPTLPHVVSYEPSYNTVLHFSQIHPDPTLPAFQNVGVSEIRNYKNSLIAHNSSRYEGMLRSLKRQCQKHDATLISHVESLERDLRNNKFDCKKIKLMYKLRSRVRKCMSI